MLISLATGDADGGTPRAHIYNNNSHDAALLISQERTIQFQILRKDAA